MIIRLAGALLLCLTALAASAAEVAGVRIEDKTRVGNADLALNGAGLRKRAFFQVYAIGLYLPQKSSSAAAVLEQPGPKRVAIQSCVASSMQAPSPLARRSSRKPSGARA